MRSWRVLLVVGAVFAGLVLAGGQPLAAKPAPLPIPQGPALSPHDLGHPATADPLTGVPAVPQHPFLAPNGNSGIHDDGWQSNTYLRAGPLGNDPQQTSAFLGGAECGSITFDQRGRLVATCVGTTSALYLFDPHTLATLARYPLPGRKVTGLLQDPNVFTSFGGGGYFYLDNQDRAVVGTTSGHILVIAETPAGTGFRLVHDYNLSSMLRAGETLNSALPDSNGLLWFVTKADGVVGTLDLASGVTHIVRLGSGSDSEIENSFAVGQDGDVYIATDRALYRFVAGAGGAPQVVWQAGYANGGKTKPGQVDNGTGTTPAIMSGGYVAITDNANPMDVVVFRTAADATDRIVCTVPVFGKNASDTENSLIAAGNTLIVENNYGYSGPAATELGGTTRPGFARVDVDAAGTGCTVVWTTRSVSAPTVVPKLSLATGLVYTYTKPAVLTDPWYWTALDERTGAVVWRILAGTGIGYNNNYAGLTLGPDGTAYLGTLGGIIELRDG
jgi:hypothetical protein